MKKRYQVHSKHKILGVAIGLLFASSVVLALNIQTDFEHNVQTVKKIVVTSDGTQQGTVLMEINSDGEGGVVIGNPTDTKSNLQIYGKVIAGDSTNQGLGELAFVGGGYSNQAIDSYTTIGGGHNNQAKKQSSTIGGGESNSTQRNFCPSRS